MAPIIFYSVLKSQPCRAVYVFLEVNKIPYTFHKIDLLAGERLPKEVSPFGAVPVIDDDGFVLAESGAIFRYLATKFGLPDHWYPSTDIKKRARVDEYLHWHHTNTRPHAMKTFQHKFISIVRGKPMDEAELAKHEKLLREVIIHLDSHFLKDNTFLCGDEISVADLQAACELYQLNGVGAQAFYTGNAKVAAWIERVRTRLQPSFECNITETAELNKTYQTKLAGGN